MVTHKDNVYRLVYTINGYPANEATPQWLFLFRAILPNPFSPQLLPLLNKQGITNQIWILDSRSFY
jgi:hypothetical protein